MTARTAKPSIITVIREQRCVGCLLNRGVTGWEAWDAADLSIGLYETPELARDAVLQRGSP